jgi:hypothetical protein
LVVLPSDARRIQLEIKNEDDEKEGCCEKIKKFLATKPVPKIVQGDARVERMKFRADTVPYLWYPED